MISKFEKRVIAVLLAAILCLPLSAIPALSASAAEVQEEAVQEQRETDMDQVGQETTEDDSLPTAGDAETADAGRELKAADSNDIETLEVPADGSPLNKTTEITEAGKIVRYAFTPEISGWYCVSVTGLTIADIGRQSGPFVDHIISILSGSSDGVKNVKVELTAGVAYSIGISMGGDHTGNASWHISKVLDVACGSHTTEIKTAGDVYHYRLTYDNDSTGYYYFQMDEAAFLEVGNNDDVQRVYNQSYISVDTQTDCFIDVAHKTEGGTGSISWTAESVAVQNVKAGEKNHSSLTAGEKNTVYTFVPETSGYYSFSTTPNHGVTMFDSSWNKIEVSLLQPIVTLEQGKTYYIILNRGNGSYDEVEWWVYAVSEVTVEAEEEYTWKYQDREIYYFTPGESGRYHLWFETTQELQYCQFYIEDPSSEDLSSGNVLDNYRWANLEAGVTYEINVYSNADVKWGIRKGVVEAVEEEKQYTQKVGSDTEYQFKAGAAGTYIVTVEGDNSITLFDSNWNKRSCEEFQDGDTYGYRVPLSEGEICYINISPGKEVNWIIGSVKSSGNYGYRVLGDGTAQLMSYAGTEKELAVPDTIDGKTVSSIGLRAFADNSNLTGLTIPDTVTEIRSEAFNYCTNLESIAFEDETKLKFIGNEAFEGCSKLNLALPSGLTELGDYAFAYTGLTIVTIPDSVTNVGTGAFAECNNLTEVTLAKGMEKIPDAMFYNCAKLETVNFTESITAIGADAFVGCTSLSELTIPKSVTEIYAHSVGYSYKDVPIENFTIYGETGSAAQTYAEENGFKFVEIGEGDPDPDPEPTPDPITLPYADVNESDWFYDTVADVYQKGLMTGKDAATFAPGEALARAQFAVVLHRIEKEPAVTFNQRFQDIAEGIWYTNAILWAADEGVVTGYSNGNFGPGDKINREQMATMMFRYANAKGLDTSQRADFSNYPDAGNVSDFAQEAMSWCVANGIITGDNGRLNPQGETARAVCATIISRFYSAYNL